MLENSSMRERHPTRGGKIVQMVPLFVSSLLIGVPANGALAEELVFSYGVDITSNYIAKGSTQTEDGAAIQPYFGASYGLFYAGVWGSNVKFAGASDIEVDVYAGVTPSWGNFDFDISFARYLYRDDNTNYGEAIIKTDWAASDRVTLGLDYFREVYADQNWLYVNAELTELPWELTLSGGFGSDFGSQDLGHDKYAVDVGLSRSLNDNMSADLRFYGGSYSDELVVFTLSIFN